ncbi:MAG: metalloprotease-like protein [Pseudonocardiaceae bacterium]|nr:metalloprotease-like protein [Pseudonocardiaceae bacterium]
MTAAFRLVALLLAVTVLGGCARTIAGHATAAEEVARGPIDTSFIQGSDGGEVDQLAAATLLDLRSYWRQTFEATFARPWTDVGGGFHSVDTTDLDAAAPPCVAQPGAVEGNAYYCALADAIVWDRSALFPVLAERFGDAAVVVVLAHEMGHAVHHRLGVDRELRQVYSQAYPTVVTEAMADCYAGAFVRWVTDGNAEHLRIDREELDLALSALVTFRDPVGTSAGAAAAHGNGFDRVSSFQDGYEQGPRRCAGFSMADRAFTQERFTSIADQASGGDLPFDRLLGSMAPDLNTYFARIVAQRGGQWQPLRLRPVPRTPDCSGDQGPTALCPTAGVVAVNGSDELRRLHNEVGDYATGLLLASRYGLAALDGLGRPIEGERAGRTALCLAGSYSGALLGRDRGFSLSPGDLDEAVRVLLALDYGSRDARGRGDSTGFERVATFRAGTVGGVAACGL